MQLKTRYALTILVLIVISVTAVASATLVRVRLLLDETQRQSASEMTVALRHDLTDFGLSRAGQLAAAMAEPLHNLELDKIHDLLSPMAAQESVLEVNVFDPTGLVIHDGTETLDGYGRHIGDDPVVRAALSQRKPIAELSRGVLDIAAPIVVGQQLLGGVHMHISAQAMDARIAAMNRTLQGIHEDGINDFIKVTVFLLLSLSLLGLIVAYVIARNLAQPISALSHVARRIGQGDYSAAVPVDRRDEIGDLSQAFQNMAQDLQVAHGDLARAKEEADRANKLKSQFLANMSHEIRTPMNGVLGMTELLMRTELTNRQARFVKAVKQSAEGLLNIINDILDFARIEAGKIEVDPSSHFDLHELVSDVVDLTAETSQAKNLHLAGMLDEGVPRKVKGDPNRLRQILVNLIGNAIKFTNEGEVVVRVSADRHSSTNIIRFEVTDTGIGIAPEAQHKLFAAFEQADGSITRHFGGTGLGLAISSQLVNLMGGKIGVTSAPGEGSTFWFTAYLPESHATESGSRDGRDLAGIKVLIVDNNATSTNIIASAILGWNGHPQSVGSATAAMDCLIAAEKRGCPFDLAIIEIALPGINAIQLTQRIHAKPALADLPIIVMTSFDWQGDRQVAKEAGITGVLTKPVRQTELFDEIATVLADTLLITPPVPESEILIDDREYNPFGHRVLLAEDNPINQEVAKEYLAALDCEVESVFDGNQAVAAFEANEFDVILMDCQMPEMDGPAATRRIRELERLAGSSRSIPIIAVTAHAYDSDRQVCLDAGMTGYLTKPFTQDALEQVLEDAFNQGAGAGGAEEKQEHTMQETNEEQEVLDHEVLEMLAAATPKDPGSLVERVIALYLEHAPGQIEDIRSALKTGDNEQVRAAAHSLKSSSANVGVKALSAQCRALEDAARSGSISEPEAAGDALARAFADASAALEGVLAERNKGAA